MKWDTGVHFITKYYKEPEPKKMSRLEELKTMDYVAYLQTDEWYKTRAIALKKSGYRCSKCSNRDDIELHVHHKTYIRRGEERQSDLIVLCSDCHKALHFGGNA
jgi:replicative DNA helicase